MWLNGRGIGQQAQQSQPQNLGGGQIPNRNLGNLSQVPGSRPLGAFSATGAAAAGSAPGYPPFEQGSFTTLVPGYSQGQSLARPHPSGRLQSALHPQPRHQLYRLVPVEQHDLTGLGVAGHVEQGEALYQLSQPPVAGGLHQGFGAGLQMLSFPSDMGMLPGLVMQTPQGVQSSFILGGGTPQLQQALGGSAHRGQGEEQHPGMVSLVLGQMPLHLQMPGVHTVAALQPSSGVSQFLVQPQQQALFAPQGSALHSSILTHAQHMPGQDDASLPPGSRSGSGAGHEGGASSQGWSASSQRLLHTSERSHMQQSRPTTARGLSDTPQPYSGRRKPWKIALTSEQAKEIYTQRPQNAEFVGARSAAFAEQYSVNPKTIRDIWNRASWVKATQPAWTRAEFIEWRKQQESARAKSKAGKARHDDEDEDEQEGGHISRSASPFSNGLQRAKHSTADLNASSSVANNANSTAAWQAVAKLAASSTEAAGMYVT